MDFKHQINDEVWAVEDTEFYENVETKGVVTRATVNAQEKLYKLEDGRKLKEETLLHISEKREIIRLGHLAKVTEIQRAIDRLS